MAIRILSYLLGQVTTKAPFSERLYGIRPEVVRLISDAGKKKNLPIHSTNNTHNNYSLLRRAAELLRPSTGRTPLSLQEIDALEQAFTLSNDYVDVYGRMPALGPGVHVAISQEECAAIANYLALIGAKNVAEVGAGDGRLALALTQNIQTKGIRITASDPGVGKISPGPNVLHWSASETLQRINPDVIVFSWPDPGTTVDLELAQYVFDHPEKTLLIIGAAEETGSHQFFAQVMGQHRYNQIHPRTNYEYDEPPPEITIRLQQKFPTGINEVIAQDGKRYVLNRSRSKSYRGYDMGYILALRSHSGVPIPDGNSICTDYSLPPRYVKIPD